MSSKRSVSGASIVVSITMVLYILGLFGLLLINTSKLTDYFEENVLVIVYFHDNTDEVNLESICKKIDQFEFVKSTKFVSKDDAAYAYKEVLEKDFVEILGDNPLPASVEVYLDAGLTMDERENAIKTLGSFAEVEDIDFQKDLIASIEYNKRIVGNILIVLSILLVIVSLVLVNNTIRLSVYSKRFLVRSMQLVGAREWFIIAPFVRRSMIHVIIASILAIGLTILTYFVIGGWLQSNVLQLGIDLISINAFKQDFKIYSLLFAMLFALGMIIVIPGTFFATQKYLRMRIDDLY